MSSSLIIGIGSTGLKMIEHAQQFHYEFTGRNSLEKMLNICFRNRY